MLDSPITNRKENKMSTMMLVAFGIALFGIVILGIIGCIATIEEVEYRNYKARYDDDRI